MELINDEVDDDENDQIEQASQNNHVDVQKLRELQEHSAKESQQGWLGRLIDRVKGAIFGR